MQKILIISNESIFYDKSTNSYFCDNIDMKSSPEGLSLDHEISIIGRKSKKKRFHQINIKDIKNSKSIFSYISNIYKSSKIKDLKYLIISISPFTFLACITLWVLRKRSNVYLRSDGFGEYGAKAGILGRFIYYLMFSVISKISQLISCRDYILRGKRGKIVSPTQIDEDWFKNRSTPNFERIRLLYIGRMRVEKGIFSLLNILKSSEQYSLTIAGAEHNSVYPEFKNVQIKEIINNKFELIKTYDESNIFILPSFTEGHPMVLFEALVRLRPVIIFEEIEHVVRDYKGIFVCKRDLKSLEKTIESIKKGHKEIETQMKKNLIPSRKDFISQLSEAII